MVQSQTRLSTEKVRDLDLLFFLSLPVPEPEPELEPELKPELGLEYDLEGNEESRGGFGRGSMRSCHGAAFRMKE